MKETHKKILGFAGLAFVTAMTVFAVFLPSPGAVAATSSVTDTIVVRVLPNTTYVKIDSPKNGESTVSVDQPIAITINDVDTVTAIIKYTDADGNEMNKTIVYNPEPGATSSTIPINLYEEFGYGDFVIEIIATNAEGGNDRDAISFKMIPITGTAEQDDNTGDVNVDLNYDGDNVEIDYIDINVYDKDHNLVTAISPLRVPRPSKTVKLPFEEHNLPDGKYYIEITATDIAGIPIQPPYVTELDYTAPTIPVPDTGGDASGAPNTGGLLVGLNISKSDYLITGLIIFFLFSIFGAIFIARRKQDKKRR